MVKINLIFLNMKRISKFLIISNLLILVMFASCDSVEPQPEETVESVTSFYLLNEGSWGSNNASLDFYDYRTGVYNKNIFSQINPDIVGGFGDVGNDLQIYGGKLYAVINNSGLVEVMNSKTAQHIGKLLIPNCRNIVFYGKYAYVSSFAGEVLPDYTQLGYVAKIDTATLQEVGRVNVGFQPEGLAVANGKLYVANSGGYNAPNYDNRIFIIDIQSFTKIKEIEVAINLSRMEKDAHGNIYVLSVGNYGSVLPKIYKINTQNDVVSGNITLAASNFCVSGDSIYFYYSEDINWETYTASTKYYIYNLNTQQIVNENIITDGTQIQMPHNIAVNPTTKEIFVADMKAGNISGELFCFSPKGKKLWNVTTGVTPNKIVFLTE
jgi:DNA-binding beta-propeller fold protein YncE